VELRVDRHPGRRHLTPAGSRSHSWNSLVTSPRDQAARPSAALVRRLSANGPGIRLGAVHDGELIGLARIDLSGPNGAELLVAVAASWRRRGIALALGREVVARAHVSGIPRIVMRTSYRGSELRDLGASLGFRVVDLGHGRVDLVRVLAPHSQTA
jgi:GNAT superfamily N-acetyltransferase